MIDDLKGMLERFSPEKAQEVISDAIEMTEEKWIPNPGP